MEAALRIKADEPRPQPMEPLAGLRVLTVSEEKTFRRCAREHHYRYRLGYVPTREEDAPRFGSLVHRALEEWWVTDGDLDAALTRLDVDGVDPFDRARARAMMLGYHVRWSGVMPQFDVLAVELPFFLPLVNPSTGARSKTWQLGGKIDALVRDRLTGFVHVVEHKTTSEDVSGGSDYWKRLRLDAQVSRYRDAAEALGIGFVAGCIYDVLRKPGLRPGTVPALDTNGLKIVLDRNGNRVETKTGKWRQTGDAELGFVLQGRPETPDEFEARCAESIAEAPDRHYGRGDVVRLEDEVAEYRFDLWHTARIIRESEIAERAPRNPESCVRFGRTCAYFGKCSGEASLDDTSSFTKTTVTHTELGV